MSFLGIGNTPQVNFSPPNASGGGITSTFNGRGYTTKASGERSGLVGEVSDTFGEAADASGNLISRVAPGVSLFRSAALRSIDDNKSAAIGNLRDNLSRRRVLGSSFGQDAISRASAEFAKQSADIEAATVLKEIEMTNQLTQQTFTLRRQQFQTGLDELNLQADISTKLAGNATNAMASAAMLDAKLEAQSQAGAGKMIGMAAAVGLAPFTGGASLLALPALAGRTGGAEAA